VPRSDPARSDYCATRHLLRHLNDARQLRRNPLTRDAFAAGSEAGALETVGARVARALAAMDARVPCERRWQSARQLAILMRVDVRRHAAVRVAADLGLSARQFYRERRCAHARFLQAYRSAERAVVTFEAPLAERLLERASGLADSGETASARAILGDVAGSGGDPDARAAALVKLAEIDAWAHRFDGAHERLRAAGAVLAESPAPRRRKELDDAYAAVALGVRWFAEGPAAVEREAKWLTVRGRRVTLTRAAAAVRSGESATAARLLRTIDAAGATPDIAIDVLTLQAELADFTDEDPLRSERLLTQAIDLARKHGYQGRELYARHQLYSTRWMRSRDAGVRAAYRQLVDGADRALPARLRASLAFCAADIEVAIGHPRRALQAAEAAAAASTNAYEMLSANALGAAALLHLGRVADAGTQAAAAAEAARSARHLRVVSLAQRISAQALLARGERRAARQAIEESIDCARRFSSVHVLSQAQAVLGRITGRAGMPVR
jgi:hypothetical protein